MIRHPFNAQRISDFWTTTRELRITVSPSSRFLHCTNKEPHISVPEPETPESVHPMALLEAALFLAKEPMSPRRLAQLAGLPDKAKTRRLLRELNQRYERNHSSFCIVEVAEGFQLRTRPEFAVWLTRMQGMPAAIRLSNPAMETLTVIAYRQPVPRTEVERIRGVQCGDLIRQLLDQDLAKIVGRSEELGRPFLYGTTPKFLETFGLTGLQDLPGLEPALTESPC